MAIPIEQASVEVGLTGFIHLVQQWLEPCRPAITGVNGTAVAVVNSFIGKKHRQSGHRVALPIDLNHGLLPLELVFKLCLPVPGKLWLQPTLMQGPVRFSCSWMDGHS